MANYSKFKLTNLGLELQTKVQAGAVELDFTRFGMGNGSFYFPGDVPALTALVNEKMSRPVQAVRKIAPDSCKVTTAILAENLPVQGFDMTEIGLFATDPDLGEILYGVVYAGTTADHIPAKADGSPYEYVINLVVAIGDDLEVVVKIDEVSSATRKELEDHLKKELTNSNDAVRDKHLSDADWRALNNDRKNLLINGCFRINQRGVSGAVSLEPGEYGHDRWCAGDGGCSYTFANSDDGIVITIASGSLVQKIENLNLRSGVHTLSWSGSSSARINFGEFESTSPVQMELEGNVLASVEFGVGTVCLPQFEYGDFASPYDRRSIGAELFHCQRYFWTISPTNWVASGIRFDGGKKIRGSIRLPVTMRGIPSVEILNMHYQWKGASHPAESITVYGVAPSIVMCQFVAPEINDSDGVAIMCRPSGLRVDSEL